MKKNKYRILMWDKKDIAKFLKLPEIEQAVFNFSEKSKKYGISVSGFNKHGGLVGTSELSNYKSKKKPEPDLDNVYTLGLFFVPTSDIAAYSGNGSYALYFVPKAYSPDPEANLKYVSYDVYNVPPEESDTLVPAVTINPSPPRNR